MTIQIFSVIPRLTKTTFLTSAGLAALLVQMPVLAQDDQAQTDNEAVLEEVIVTGVRASLDSAAEIKREASQMVDAISAEDIGMFSDNNIAEALQRVPGVQLERDMGEGFRVSIRGLGPRFVRTTVNGRTALSAAGGEDGSSEDSRGFTLNMMPSEVITRVTVEKSTQAKNLEGGIGGTLDLQTNRPIDFAEKREQDWYLSGAARAGYNDLVDNMAYRGSLFVNNKTTDNFGWYFGMVLDDTDRTDYAVESEAYRVRTDLRIDRLEPGTLINGVAMSEDELDALYDSMQNVGPDGEDAGISMANAARNTARDFDRGRQTYTMGMQWKQDAWDINFDWTYGHEDNDQYLRRFVTSTNATARRDEAYVTSLVIDYDDQNFDRSMPTIGHLESMTFENARGDERVGTENRYIPRDQDIHVGGLNVDWQGDLWNVNWDIGYAEQHTKRYDHQVGTQLNSDDRLRWETDPAFERLNGWFDASDFITTAGLTGVDEDGNLTAFDPTDLNQYKFRRVWFTLTEEWADDTSSRIDLIRDFDSGGFFDALMFGVAWNERNGRREKARWRENDVPGRGGDLTPIDNNGLIGQYQGVVISNYRPDIPGVIHDYVFLDNHDPVFDPIWALSDDELNTIQSNEFNVTEEVLATYIQFPFSGERVRGNFGLRYVMTDQSGLGWVGGTTLSADKTELLDVYVPEKTQRDYNDMLPSFNIAFDLSDTFVMRFAANKALTRADPLDLTSYLDLNTIEDLGDEMEEGSGSGGNPDLEPYYTDSYDMSFEWYPESGGAYAIGLFFKDVDGWIARGRSSEYYTAPVGVDGNGDGEFDEDDIITGEPGDGGDYYEIREELYSIRRMVNTDGGTIKGVEASFHQPFDAFTDGFWSYFGINGSLTWVDAEMDAVVPENNLPISLRGTSEWSGNLVVYYERKKFAARLAMNYRDDYLFQEAEDPDRHDEWTQGGTILDLNMDYRFNRRWVLRFSANNLTGETRTRYWQTAGMNRFSDDRDNGQYYTLELRYRSR